MRRSVASSVRWWFAGLIAVVLLAAVVRFVLAENIANNLDRTLGRIEDARDANGGVLQALTDVETGVRGYLLTSDRAFLEPAIRGRTEYAAAMARALARTPSAHAARLLRAERAAAQTWLSSVAAPIMAPGADEAANRAAEAPKSRALFDDVRAANAEVAAALDQNRAAALKRLRTASRLASIAGLLLSLLSSACALLVARVLGRSLINPLQGLRRTLVQLSAGDRSARAHEAGPPEMREVIQAFNEMCEESERLRGAEHRRMQMQTLAYEIGARLRESLQRGEVFAEAAAALGAALRLDRAYVQLTDDGDAEPITRHWARSGLEPLATDVRVPKPREEVIRAAAPPDDPLAVAFGAGAYVSAPFGFDHDEFGVVVLVSSAPREWLPDELGLIEAVCLDLSRVLQNVRLYEHERELVNRLRELDQHKTDFIATVSHELRTPLTSVLGYLEVLTSGDQGPLTERQMKSLRVIERNAERLGEMVADLLTLSRIESGAFALELRPVQVLQPVRRAADSIAPIATGVGIELTVDVPEELWTTGDAAQLQRVVVNLLGNAVKFGGTGGRIDVRAHGDDNGHVLLEVSDNGDGIPEHEQAALFEPFHRGSNAVANATQGPGLGLAVVRSIVEQHGGTVRLTSAPGAGTTVTIVLPAAQPASAAQGAAAVAGTA